jgi:tRNA pseudouridine38-40 synthase
VYHKACVCEYEGTAYCGWQWQPGKRSIQESIETALEKLYACKIRIEGSGRTDSGVHALGQIFSFHTEIFRDNCSIVQALNSTLPKDIGILSAEDVPPDFNARFCAAHKTYLYKILNRATRAAVDRNRVWYRRVAIDAAALKDSLTPLAGAHDFTSFCVAESVKKDMVRTINFITVEKTGHIINIRINADGFLHNMVRIIVGTAVNIVINNEGAEKMKKILDAKNRTAAGVTAPPHGLHLESVHYNKKWL